MKKRRNDYRSIDPDPVIQQTPGERVIITSDVDIDYSVFQKTPEEKQRLKDAKRGIVRKKRCRPGKEQRHRIYLQRQAE